jgi:hypothetical protein
MPLRGTRSLLESSNGQNWTQQLRSVCLGLQYAFNLCVYHNEPFGEDELIFAVSRSLSRYRKDIGHDRAGPMERPAICVRLNSELIGVKS